MTPFLFLLIIIHCLSTLIMNTIIITSFILPIESGPNIIIYCYFNRGEKNTSTTKPNQNPIHPAHRHYQYFYIIVVGVTPSLLLFHTTIKNYYMLIVMVSIVVFVHHRYIIISILKSISILIFIIKM